MATARGCGRLRRVRWRFSTDSQETYAGSVTSVPQMALGPPRKHGRRRACGVERAVLGRPERKAGAGAVTGTNGKDDDSVPVGADATAAWGAKTVLIGR